MKYFINNGFEQKNNFFKKKDCEKLKKDILKTRNFNNIWLSERNYKINKIIKTFNPRPGRNLIEKLNTEFIFSNEKFINLVDKLLGSKWKVLDYKLVVAVNVNTIPLWIKKITSNVKIPNLGRFIKEKFRDITYFSGIDFHQDIIDYPHKQSDFITFYLYLDEVKNNSSPLILLPKSHLYGAKIFPHKLIKLMNNKYKYYITDKKFKILNHKILKGKTGNLYFWHPCMLHGTQPSDRNDFRISVRILIEKNQSKEGFIIDKINKKLLNLNLVNARNDINNKGSYIKFGNNINKLKVI